MAEMKLFSGQDGNHVNFQPLKKGAFFAVPEGAPMKPAIYLCENPKTNKVEEFAMAATVTKNWSFHNCNPATRNDPDANPPKEAVCDKSHFGFLESGVIEVLMTHEYECPKDDCFNLLNEELEGHKKICEGPGIFFFPKGHDAKCGKAGNMIEFETGGMPIQHEKLDPALISPASCMHHQYCDEGKHQNLVFLKLHDKHTMMDRLRDTKLAGPVTLEEIHAQSPEELFFDLPNSHLPKGKINDKDIVSFHHMHMKNTDQKPMTHACKIVIQREDLAPYEVMVLSAEPGWQWNSCVQPNLPEAAQNGRCDKAHFGLGLHGEMKVWMKNEEAPCCNPGCDGDPTLDFKVAEDEVVLYQIGPYHDAETTTGFLGVEFGGTWKPA